MPTKAELLERIEDLQVQITSAHRRNRDLTISLAHMEEMFALVKKTNGLYLIEGTGRSIDALAHTVGDLRQLLKEAKR